ncbi:RecX family transcriptional regulator [Vibrio sp. D431a]|uniref:RecX family transcriptional regulator n=1 Tax=Vibrio sp. D431a TaxID=2837388 RepID=UPI0025569720|nr:RecX family transcriptional regulator [Vibrio sp. D431a]MDK9789911.1 RecX family transcriptional regulator [Vibrio sp. D431a]
MYSNKKKEPKPKYKQVKNYEELMVVVGFHLGRSELTIDELRTKIERNTLDTDLINRAIERMLEVGALKTNEKYIENFTEYRARNYYSKKGIIGLLRAKKLPSALIEEIVPDLFDSYIQNEVDSLREYLDRTYQDFTTTNKDKLYKEIQTKRGFSASQINVAIADHEALHTLRTALEVKAAKADLRTEIIKRYKKGKGRNLIKLELKQQCIDVSNYDEILSAMELSSELDFYAMAATVLSKKKYDYSDYSDLNKARGHLTRKGFTSDEIKEAIENLKASH